MIAQIEKPMFAFACYAIIKLADLKLFTVLPMIVNIPIVLIQLKKETMEPGVVIVNFIHVDIKTAYRDPLVVQIPAVPKVTNYCKITFILH